MKSIVVLLNWNGWQDTIACLASLLNSSTEDFNIIVCDNGSSDGSFDQLIQWAQQHLPNDYATTTRTQIELASFRLPIKKLLLIDNQSNLGFAGGCNVGVRAAMSDSCCQYIWLLNNDTEVATDALQQTIDYMDCSPDIGICGSTLIYHHNRQMLQALGGSHYTPWLGRSRHLGAFESVDSALQAMNLAVIESKMSYVVGAAMMIRRQVFEQIGLMTEDYFLYYEELDLAVRSRCHFRLGYAPLSKVYHKEGASIGTDASGGSPLSLYYLFRNRLLFTVRHYPQFLPTVLAFSLWEILKFILKRRWPQALSASRGICFRQAPVANKK